MRAEKEVDGKVKLSETGAKSLAEWMRAHHVNASELAELLGTHAMTPGRALRRQAFLTLEQVGRIVARAGGALTAEMLVGRERAPAIPVLPMSAPEQPRPAPAPPRSPLGPDVEDDDDEVFGVTEAKRDLLRLARDSESAPGVKANCLFKLARMALLEAEAAREAEKASGVREADLMEKFNTLLFNARRQAEGAEALQPPVPAPVVKP